MSQLTLDVIHPLDAKILVRRYEKPEQMGHIVLPDSFRADDTGSLWEVVKCGPKVGQVLGIVPEPDDILRTPIMGGVYVDKIDDVDYFMVHAGSVLGVFSY